MPCCWRHVGLGRLSCTVNFNNTLHLPFPSDTTQATSFFFPSHQSLGGDLSSSTFIYSAASDAMVILTRLNGSQSLFLALAVAGLGDAEAIKRQATSSPVGTLQVFQTTPELFAGKSFVPFLASNCLNCPTGPTTTGLPPFMAETNTILIPNDPLETSQPIPDNPQHKSIFRLLGNQSPYYPHPVGFGVDEYPLPKGANITQVHALLRHGARYPNITTGIETILFGERLNNASGTLKAKGDLTFLNTYKYQLGAEIQTSWGRQQ